MLKHVLVALATFPMIAGASDLASSLAPGTLEVTGITFLEAGTGSDESKGGGVTASADSTSVSLLTAAQYYVLPNLGVGLHLGYGYFTADFQGSSFTDTDYSIGPVVTYAVPVAPELALFGSADGSWLYRRSSSSGSADHTMDGYGFGLRAGVKYFPARRVSLDAGLGWSWQRFEQPGLLPGSPDVTTTSTRLGLHLGVSVYFGGGR